MSLAYQNGEGVRDAGSNRHSDRSATVEPSGAVVDAVTVIEVAVSLAGTVTTTESESAAGARVALVSSEDHAKVEPAGSGIAVPLSSSSAVKVPVEPALIAICKLLTVTEKYGLTSRRIKRNSRRIALSSFISSLSSGRMMISISGSW